MKNYLFILSLLFLTACTNYKKTDLDIYQLKGNVSSVKILTYYADSKFGEIIKEELLYDGVSVVDFNKSGYITSISSYIKNGNLYSILYEIEKTYHGSSHLSNMNTLR